MANLELLNLVIKILQDLQARMARLEAGQNRLEVRMTALEQHFAAALMLTASDRAEPNSVIDICAR